MDLRLTDAAARLRDVARAFAAEAAPEAAAIDRAGRPSDALLSRLAACGLLGSAASDAQLSFDSLSLVVMVEEVSVASAALGALLSAHHAFLCDAVVHFGDAAHKARLRATLAQGSLGAGAPEARLEARASGSGYVLQGSCARVVNGPFARLVLCCGAPSEGGAATAFLIPDDAAGFAREAPDERLALRAASSCSLVLRDVQVAEPLGAPGQGALVMARAREGLRLGAAARALGVARAALERAARHLAETAPTTASPVPPRQGARFMLVDMASELDAARLLVLRAASRRDQGNLTASDIDVAQLYAVEMSHRVTHAAAQIVGSNDPAAAYDLERYCRDARGAEAGEGTSESMRSSISAEALQQEQA